MKIDWLRVFVVALLSVVGMQSVVIYRRNTLITELVNGAKADVFEERKILEKVDLLNAIVDEAVKQYRKTIQERDLCLVRETIKDAQIAQYRGDR